MEKEIVIEDLSLIKEIKLFLTLTLSLKVIDLSGGKYFVDNKIPFSSSI
jgi:hypothetical protein